MLVDMQVDLQARLLDTNDLSAARIENETLKAQVSQLRVQNDTLVQTVKDLTCLHDLHELVEELVHEKVKQDRHITKLEDKLAKAQRFVRKTTRALILFEESSGESEDNDSFADDDSTGCVGKNAVLSPGRPTIKKPQAISAATQTIPVEVPSLLMVAEDPKKAERDAKLLKLRKLKQSPAVEIKKARDLKIVPGSVRDLSTTFNKRRDEIAEVSVPPKSTSPPDVQLAAAETYIQEKSDHITEPELLAEVAPRAIETPFHIEEPEVLDVVAPQAIKTASETQEGKYVVGEELNYSDVSECTPLLLESGHSGGALIYKNADEIELDFSDESSEGENSNTERSVSPVCQGPHEIWLSLPAAVKAIDLVVEADTAEWENTDDESCPQENSAVPVTYPDPVDQCAPLSDEELARLGLPPMSEKERARKQFRYELLYTWKDDAPEANPVHKFKEDTEPPSIFYTGFNSSRCIPEDSVSTNMSYMAASLRSPPNNKLFPDNKSQIAALTIHQEDEYNLPQFFRYGLCYVPTAYDIGQKKVFRTVHLSNLPTRTTIGDLTARIRGGMLVSATILDTMNLTGSKSARVVFLDSEDAEQYVEFAAKNPITFGGKEVASVTLVTTPTYPINQMLEDAMDRRDLTRYLEIPEYPAHKIHDKALLLQLISKPVQFVQCGHRAASIEEPKYDVETGIMHLGFASVELAQTAFVILQKRALFTRLNLEPKFAFDPCEGDLEELLDLPPMAYEIEEKIGQKSYLEEILESFEPSDKAPTVMSAIPSFGSMSILPAIAEVPSAPAAVCQITSPVSDLTKNEEPMAASTTEKTYPLLLHLNTYSEVVADAEWHEYGSRTRSLWPKTMTRKQYDELMTPDT